MFRLFLGCCLSALLTALVMFIIDFYLMVAYYTARAEVLTRSCKSSFSLSLQQIIVKSNPLTCDSKYENKSLMYIDTVFSLMN